MRQDRTRLAYTLSRAAELLDRKPQLVGQLLKSGALEGPTYPGKKRAPPNAPRVWHDSLINFLENNPQYGTQNAAEGVLSGPHSESIAANVAELHRRLEGIERSLRAAALHLKAAADVANQRLLEDRQRHRRQRDLLLTIVVQSADVIRELANEIDGRQDGENAALEAYSEALTQLLSPDNPNGWLGSEREAH